MLSEKELREVVRRVVEGHLGASGGASPAPVGPPPAAPPGPSATAAGPAAPATAPPAPKSLALGADHGGYDLKERLKPLLYELGWAVDDCGTFSEAPVDYPDIALRVASKVAGGQVRCGIVIDGAGIGSAMAANKVPGVRAALCHDVSMARNSREHNDANVLTLGGRMIGIGLAQEIVRTWLGTACTEERHRKRVAMIDAIERRFATGAAPAEAR